jgi:GH24 family phage-related lysozyme (muramidase)
LKGGAAESASHGLRSIKVSEAAADAVFAKFTVPVWIKTTAECFPGSDKLPAKCFGALVSLVYNRGPSVEGSSRREMLEIKKLIQAGAPQSVPTSIRSMKRLWIGKDEDGLLVRRDAEAALFEEGLKTVQTAAEA